MKKRMVSSSILSRVFKVEFRTRWHVASEERNPSHTTFCAGVVTVWFLLFLFATTNLLPTRSRFRPLRLLFTVVADVVWKILEIKLAFFMTILRYFCSLRYLLWKGQSGFYRCAVGSFVNTTE